MASAVMLTKPDLLYLDKSFSHLVLKEIINMSGIEVPQYAEVHLEDFVIKVKTATYNPFFLVPDKSNHLVYDKKFKFRNKNNLWIIDFDYNLMTYTIEQNAIDIENKNKNNVDTKFVVGAKYTLTNIAIESKKVKEYICKKVLHEYKGEVVDIVIMKCTHKQEDEDIFTLTKNDCKSIGMKYERGLQVFSEFENFECIEVQKDEVKENNKTYPKTTNFNKTSYCGNKTSYCEGFDTQFLCSHLL